MAASELGQLDPPADQWAAIEARLADAEIADAQRPRSWWWWQRLRPQALPVAVGAVAVVALLVWSQQRQPQPAQSSPPALAVATTGDANSGAGAVGEEPSFTEQRLAEVVSADRLYHDAIADLNLIIAEERRGWSARQIAEFDAELAAIEATAKRQRQAVAINQSHDPATRDDLFAVYQTQIGFLQRAALGDLRR